MSDINKYIRKIRRLLFLQGNVCFFCHKPIPLDETSIEHLVPTSKGGSNDDDNTVVVCRTTNEYLGNMSIKQKMAILLHHNGPIHCPRMEDYRYDAPSEPTNDTLVSVRPTTTTYPRPRMAYGSRRFGGSVQRSPAARPQPTHAVSGEQQAAKLAENTSEAPSPTPVQAMALDASSKMATQVQPVAESFVEPEANFFESESHIAQLEHEAEQAKKSAKQAERAAQQADARERFLKEQQQLADLTNRLDKQGSSRPRKYKKLLMAAGNWFPELEEEQLRFLLDRLAQQGVAKMVNQDIVYPAFETLEEAAVEIEAMAAQVEPGSKFNAAQVEPGSKFNAAQDNQLEPVVEQPSGAPVDGVIHTESNVVQVETNEPTGKARPAKVTKVPKAAKEPKQAVAQQSKAAQVKEPKPAKPKLEAKEAAPKEAKEAAPKKEAKPKTVKRTSDEQRLIEELLERLKAKGRSKPRKLANLLGATMDWFPQISEAQAKTILEHLLYSKLIAVTDDNVSYQLN